MKFVYSVLALFALLCVTAQSANLKTWSKERIPSLLEVSAKLKTKSPASEILEMLMKISHNIHMDLDNDKDKQEEDKDSENDAQAPLMVLQSQV